MMEAKEQESSKFFIEGTERDGFVRRKGTHAKVFGEAEALFAGGVVKHLMINREAFDPPVNADSLRQSLFHYQKIGRYKSVAISKRGERIFLYHRGE